MNILDKKLKRGILFLGAGSLQQISINSAIQHDYITLGVDKNKNSKSSKLCDFFLNCDSTDIVTIYNWVCSLQNIEVFAVWANNDILIPTRVSLEQALNVKAPYASHSICLDMLSKERFSFNLKETGLVAKSYDVSKKNKFKYPLIIKPKKGSGSLGIKLVKSFKDIDFFDFKPESHLLEEYLSGDEYGTNHFSDGKTVVRLPAVRRYFDHNLTMVPLGTVTANMHEPSLKKACSQLEDLILDKKWIGPIKSDIIINMGKMRIIEMSARFHGEIDTSIVFNYLNVSLPNFYFLWLSSNKNLELNEKKDFNFGYISIFNNSKLSKKFVNKIFSKYNLEYLSTLNLRKNNKKTFPKSPKSTKDLLAYVFYRSKTQLSIKKFSNLFKDINLVV